MKIILLQLFWLSFIIIGAGVWKLLGIVSRRVFNYRTGNEIIDHWLVKAFLAYATGLASFAMLVVPGCLLDCPIYIIEYAYIGSLVITSAWLIKRAWTMRRNLRLPRLSRSTMLWTVVIVAVLGLDFWMSLHGGGEPIGDAPFEFAQMTLFAHGHLTLSDPVFGISGVPPTAYSTSIQHALQAVAMRLFDTSAVWVWFYSHAIFRLTIWVSLFSVAWATLSSCKQRVQWSYAVLLLMPLLQGANFPQPEIHNQIVTAWIALLLIGLKLWAESDGLLILSVGAILIAATHPLNSLMAAAYVTLVSLVLLALKYKTIKQVWPLTPLIMLLLLPMLLYQYYPHGITSAGFNDHSYHGSAINLRHWGPLVFNLPKLDFNYIGLTVFILFLAFLGYSRRLKNSIYKNSFLILGYSAVLLSFSLQLVSLVGYAYLIKSSHKAARIALLVLVLFALATLYNPVLLSLFTNHFPLWTLGRAKDFNVLSIAAPIVGLLWLTNYLFRFSNPHLKAHFSAVLTVLLFVFVVPLIAPQLFITNLTLRNKQSDQQGVVAIYDTLAKFKGQLQGQIVFTDDRIVPPFLPGAVPTNVFSIENEANANPAVHIAERKKCAQNLRQRLTSEDLYDAGITQIITTPQSSKLFISHLQDSPNIEFEKTADGYSAYRVQAQRPLVRSGSSICRIPPTSS